MVAVTVAAIASPVRAQANPAQTNAPAQSTADDKAAMDQRLRNLEDRIVMLEGEIRQLKAQGAPPAAAGTTTTAGTQPAPAPETGAQQPAATAPASQADAVRLGGAGGAASKALNPDISMIGDFIASAGHNPINPTPSFQMHESELGIQAIIDPYARGDFFLSFGEEGVDLEEGYITFTALPASFVARAGKMRAAFGKVNTLHNHVLPWVDRPLVTQNLVGGEDGIDDAGLSLSRILPAPKGIFMEGTAQVFRGDSDNIFRANKRSDLSTVEHLRIYHDITDNTNIDLGGSWSRGRSPFGEGWNQLYGFDATLRWKPLSRSIYHSFIARTELIWARTVAGTVIFDP